MKNGIDQYFRVCEVSDGHFFAQAIFKAKLGGVLPDYGRHIVACYKNGWKFVPLGYLNVLEHKSIALIGGGCVDGKCFADICQQHGDAISNTGGVLFSMLKYAFSEMADDYEAFFGHCGDARAEEVDLQAGFRHTVYENLLAYFHRAIPEHRKQELIDKVHQLGPF